MRYKVGDRVVLRKDLIEGRNRKEEQWSKCIITIETINPGVYPYPSDWYNLLVDGIRDDFWWDDSHIDHEATAKINNKGENKNMNEKITFNNSKEMLKSKGIKKVVFSNPYVIVYLNDGRKGSAKCASNDTFDIESGFAVAYTLAMFSDITNNSKGLFKKHLANLSFQNKPRKKDKVIVINVE